MSKGSLSYLAIGILYAERSASGTVLFCRMVWSFLVRIWSLMSDVDNSQRCSAVNPSRSTAFLLLRLSMAFLTTSVLIVTLSFSKLPFLWLAMILWNRVSFFADVVEISCSRASVDWAFSCHWTLRTSWVAFFFSDHVGWSSWGLPAFSHLYRALFDCETACLSTVSTGAFALTSFGSDAFVALFRASCRKKIESCGFVRSGCLSSNCWKTWSN